MTWRSHNSRKWGAHPPQVYLERPYLASRVWRLREIVFPTTSWNSSHTAGSKGSHTNDRFFLHGSYTVLLSLLIFLSFLTHEPLSLALISSFKVACQLTNPTPPRKSMSFCRKNCGMVTGLWRDSQCQDSSSQVILEMSQYWAITTTCVEGSSFRCRIAHLGWRTVRVTHRHSNVEERSRTSNRPTTSTTKGISIYEKLYIYIVTYASLVA